MSAMAFFAVCLAGAALALASFASVEAQKLRKEFDELKRSLDPARPEGSE